MKAKGKSWFSMRAAKPRAAGEPATGYVSLYGDIGGYGLTANDFRDALAMLGDVGTLRVNITSDGGDISAGYAIYNLLASHPAKKIMTVDSLAASMASVIFMAGDERIMPKNAFLMIHNPWGAMMGSGDEFISFGQALLDMQDAIVESYVDTSGQKPKVIRDMMDKETWLKASTAKKLGFATKVVDPRELNASRDVSFERVSTFNRAPRCIRALTKESKMTKRNKVADDDFENLDDTPKTAAEIRAEILEQQGEIRSLCALAGLPKMADKFIADDADMKTVRAELAKAQKAAKDAAKAAAKSGKKGAKNPFEKEEDEDEDEDDAAKDELSARRASRLDRAPAEINTGDVYAKFNKRR